MHRFVCVALLCSFTALAQAQDPAQLFSAIRRDDINAVESLLRQGVDPNSRNQEGATALMWAAGDADKGRLLIEAGADVNAKSKLGRTALIIAATSAGNVETVRLLLAKGADPKLVDRNGDGPVGSAASAGDAAILRVVLANGGSTTELVRSGGNFRGYTPLTRAAQATCMDCARLLLEHGASVNP